MATRRKCLSLGLTVSLRQKVRRKSVGVHCCTAHILVTRQNIVIKAVIRKHIRTELPTTLSMNVESLLRWSRALLCVIWDHLNPGT